MPARDSSPWPSLRSGPMAAWLVASPPDGHVPAYFLLNGSSCSLTLSLPRAMSAASCSLMHFAIVASSRPTVETQQPSAQNFLFPDLYLRSACLAGHEECALPLQAAHEARHADSGRDADQHVHVVRHQVPLHCLDALPLAWLPEDRPQVLAALAADGLPSMLCARHDVVPAHPLGVRKAAGLLCHRSLLPLAAGDLNNHHPGGGGVSLHSIVAIHPHSGWLSVPRGTESHEARR